MNTESAARRVECPDCDGGVILTHVYGWNQIHPYAERRCQRCGGSGTVTVWPDDCSWCDRYPCICDDAYEKRRAREIDGDSWADYHERIAEIPDDYEM